jgi:hypothetical protein
MTRPSATVPKAAPLWPPPRIAMGRSCDSAKPIAFATASALAQRVITAGRLSIIAFKRAWSLEPESAQEVGIGRSAC